MSGERWFGIFRSAAGPRSTKRPTTPAGEKRAICRFGAKAVVRSFVLPTLLALAIPVGFAQDGAGRSSVATDDLNQSVHELRDEVRELRSTLAEMRLESERARTETRELRRQIEELRSETGRRNAATINASAEGPAPAETGSAAPQNAAL